MRKLLQKILGIFRCCGGGKVVRANDCTISNGDRSPGINPGRDSLVHEIIEVPSPNYSSRKDGTIKSIVLHYTTTRNVQSTLDWFSTIDSAVSSHYVIDRSGKIYRCVNDLDKAWHCRGHNKNTIGIEHCAAVGDGLTDKQKASSLWLVSVLMKKYSIGLGSVYGHGELGNTSCPGDILEGLTGYTWVRKYLGNK